MLRFVKDLCFYLICDRDLLDVCLMVLSFVKHNHESKHNSATKKGTYILYARYGVMDRTLLGKY